MPLWYYSPLVWASLASESSVQKANSIARRILSYIRYTKNYDIRLRYELKALNEVYDAQSERFSVCLLTHENPAVRSRYLHVHPDQKGLINGLRTSDFPIICDIYSVILY